MTASIWRAPKVSPNSPTEMIFKSNIEWLDFICNRLQEGHDLESANRPLERMLGFLDIDEDKLLLYHMKNGWHHLPEKIRAFFNMNGDQLLLEIGLGSLDLEQHSLKSLSNIWDFDHESDEAFIHMNEDPVEMTPEENLWAQYEPRARIAIKAGLSTSDVSPEIASIMKKILKTDDEPAITFRKRV